MILILITTQLDHMTNLTTLMVYLTIYLAGLFAGALAAELITRYRDRQAARRLQQTLTGDLPALLKRQAQ